MKPIASAVAALIAAVSTSALAQWPKYTVPGVPIADGKLDLNAAVPRAADGKPDLSGVWEIIPCIDCPAAARGRGAAPATTPGRGNEAAPAPQGRNEAAPAAQGRNEAAPAAQGRAGGNGAARGGGGGGSPFGNIGASTPGGAPYLPWAADLVKKRMADSSKDNPDAHCLPMGIAQLNAHPFPRKIIQTPREVALIYEASGTTIREVYLDGRSLPQDADPWWNGYSIGRWDGDTLVVETAGFRDDGWLDVRGSPLTSAGKIIERFHRPRFGYLELEETIDDSKAYTKPFTAKMYYRFSQDTQLIEFVCIDKDAAHYVGASAPGK